MFSFECITINRRCLSGPHCSSGIVAALSYKYIFSKITEFQLSLICVFEHNVRGRIPGLQITSDVILRSQLHLMNYQLNDKPASYK